VKEAEARQQALYRQEQSRKQAEQKRVAQWAKQYDKSGGGGRELLCRPCARGCILQRLSEEMQF